MNNRSINIILGNTFGGIMSVYEVLVEYFNNNDFLSINIVTFNYQDNENTFFPNNNKINLGINPPISKFNTIKFIFKFYNIVNKKNGNKFIINNPSVVILVFFISFFKKIKYIVHIHEPISSIISKKPSLTKRLYLKLLNLALKKSIKIVFISRSVEQDYKKYFSSLNFVIIHNPISTINILEKSNIICKYTNTEYNFITVGRLTDAKGYITLIYAIEQLRKWKYDNFKLRIVGDGDMKDDLNNLINHLNLNNYIELTGYKTNPYNYIKQSDCYISSSKWEGFGLTILYAMLLKIPIISSNTEGAKVLLKSPSHFFEINNINGLAKMLGKFMDNKNILKDTIEDNFEFAKSFDIQYIGEKFKAELLNLCY